MFHSVFHHGRKIPLKTLQSLCFKWLFLIHRLPLSSFSWPSYWNIWTQGMTDKDLECVYSRMTFSLSNQITRITERGNLICITIDSIMKLNTVSDHPMEVRAWQVGAIASSTKDMWKWQVGTIASSTQFISSLGGCCQGGEKKPSRAKSASVCLMIIFIQKM